MPLPAHRIPIGARSRGYRTTRTLFVRLLGQLKISAFGELAANGEVIGLKVERQPDPTAMTTANTKRGGENESESERRRENGKNRTGGSFEAAS